MINPLSNPFYLFTPLVAAFIILSLAIVVWQKSRRGFSSRLFCGFLLCLGASAALTFGMRSSPDIHHALLWDKALVVALIPAFVLYYHFTLAYTNARKKRMIIPAIYSFVVMSAILIAATDLGIQGMSLDYYGYRPVTGPMSFVAFAPMPLLIAGGVYNLLKFYRECSSYEERNRLFYLAVAVVFPLSGVALDAFSNLPPVAIWANLIFCIICTVAIVKYHLLDIRIVVRKGLAYLLISVVIAVPYVSILLLLNQILRTKIEPWWVHAIIVLLLAILLRPLYSGAQHLVDRLFYRDRYDYLRALQQFSQKAQSVINLKELSTTLTQLVSGALRTSSACLLLSSESDSGFTVVSSTGLGSTPSGVVLRNRSLLIKWLKLQQRILSSQEFNIVPQLQSLSLREKNNLEQMEAKLYVPIQTGPGQLSGILVLGQKLSQQPYSGEDRQLLTALSNQMAIALENARLYNESQQEVRERKRAEEALLKYKMAVDSSADLIVAVDQHYVYILANQTFLKYNCLKEDQVIGHTVAEVLGEEVFRKTIKPNVDRCLQGQTVDYEMARSYPEIGRRHLNVSYHPLKSSDKQTIGVVAVIRDITERKQAEEK